VKILRKMVFREFFGLFFASLAALVMMFILVDFFDRVQKFLGEGGAPVSLLIKYLLYKTPQVLYDIMPFNLPLAALITLGVLNGRRELMAMRAAGIPIRAALRPVFLFAMFIAIVLFAMGESVLPDFNVKQKLTEIKLKQFTKKSDAAVKGKKNFAKIGTVSGWYRGSRGLYRLKNYSVQDKVIGNLTILEMGKDFKVARRIDAESAQWDRDKWVGANVVTTDFLPNGEIVKSAQQTMQISIPEKPGDFEIMEKDPKEMGFVDLAEYIDRLEEGGSNMRPFRVDLWAKLSYPLSGLILLTFAVPMGLRGGRGTGVAAGIVLSMVICLSYYEFYAWLLSLGRGGVIALPAVAAWTAPVIFGIAAIPIYLRSN